MKRSLSHLIDVDIEKFQIEEVPIEEIIESSSQARKYFDEKLLNELAESIKKNGLLQPIIVQKIDNKFQLIAGERRLRASKIAGLDTMPCLVKEVSDQDAAVLGLVENVQRSQLNTIEEALGYKSLQDNYGLSASDIGLLVGKSRPFISNLLRISNLSQEVQQALSDEQITFGQARPLIVLEHDLQNKLLNEIITLKLNSRSVETKVKELSGKIQIDEETLHLQKALEDLIGTKVVIKKNAKGFKVESAITTHTASLGPSTRTPCSANSRRKSRGVHRTST